MRNRSEGAKKRARALRKKKPVGEKAIWEAIRKDKLGFRFRPQFPVGPYILDFYCPDAKLCIEMDSDLHDEEHDRIRDEYLKTQGILTIRIHNVDYLGLDGSPSRDWLTYIQRVCEERTGRPAF